MTDADTLSVVMERDLPFPAGKIWRALTQPHLIAEWLMANDFAPTVGHSFRFTADWGGVDGRVLAVEPDKSLSYTWEAMGVVTVVTWTVTPKAEGTHLRMEQTGFRPDQPQAYQGAQWGWQKFLGELERVLGGLD